jgi:hypothetical protein
MEQADFICRNPFYSEGFINSLAERQGFEPWIPCGIHAFQACAFSHSAISPQYAGLFESNTIGHLPEAGWLALAVTAPNGRIRPLHAFIDG